MRACWYLAGAVLLISSLAAAQSDRVEVFGGFSYVNSDFSLTTQNGLKGWNASLNLKPSHYVGMVFDFSGFYPSENFGCGGCTQSAKVHTFLLGPQVSLRMKRVTPFARFLFGDANVSFHEGNASPGFQLLTGSNSFTYGAGGGVDFDLTRRIALRGQVDWLHTQYQTIDNQLTNRLTPNVVRISTGVAFRF